VKLTTKKFVNRTNQKFYAGEIRNLLFLNELRRQKMTHTQKKKVASFKHSTTCEICLEKEERGKFFVVAVDDAMHE
jgi:hypothetical protein